MWQANKTGLGYIIQQLTKLRQENGNKVNALNGVNKKRFFNSEKMGNYQNKNFN